MEGFESTLLAYVIFWFALFLICRLLKVERWSLTVKPFYIFYKTTALNRRLKSLSGRWKLFWQSFLNICAVAGVGQMALIMFFLARNLYHFFEMKGQASEVIPIIPLPGLTMSWETFPYVMIAIVVLVITHELAHGVASLVEDIPVKSSGFFFALIIPGAFVEIDDEKIEEASCLSKLRVFSAGSSTNIAVWLLFLILMMNFTTTISPLYSSNPSGIIVTKLVEGGAAEKAGIQKWDSIYALNGTAILNEDDLRSYMSRVKPESFLVASTQRGNFTLKTQPHSANRSMAAVGIWPFNYYAPKYSFSPTWLPYSLYLAEYWNVIILLSVALINMLPVYPFDGDKYVDAILKGMKVKKVKPIRSAATIFCLCLLGLNLSLSLLTFGFHKI